MKSRSQIDAKPLRSLGRALFIRDIIKVLDGLELDEGDRRKIYELNARRLLRLKS